MAHGGAYPSRTAASGPRPSTNHPRTLPLPCGKLPTAAAMKPSTPPPALPSEHDVHLTENVMVAMRDGMRMATDIYRPARGGRPLADRRPVLLHRTPYNKTETEATSGQCRFFAARGYVVVNQDCRGCFGSEGEVNFLIPEAEDGADTVAWIRKQEWCDGTVGTFGTSWSGLDADRAGRAGPRGPRHDGGEHERRRRPREQRAPGRRARAALPGLGLLALGLQHPGRARPPQPHVQAALNQGAPRFSDWLERMPIRPGQTQLALVPPYEKWALEILTRADYDDYWKHPSVDFRRALGPRPRHADPPRGRLVRLLHPRHVPELRRAWAPAVGGRCAPWWARGPTGRRPWSSPTRATSEFGHDAALPSFDELHLRWYDRWLRGVRQRPRRRGAAAHLRDGRRLRPALGRGPARARRPLARRARVAAGPDAIHRLLPARRRVAEHGRAPRGELRHHVPVRSGAPGAVHRRQRLLAARRAAAARRHRGPELRRPRRAHRRRHAPGRVRPARGGRLPRLPRRPTCRSAPGPTWWCSRPGRSRRRSR